MSELKAGDEIACPRGDFGGHRTAPKLEELSAISPVADFDSFNKDSVAFNIERGAMVSDAETVSA